MAISQNQKDILETIEGDYEDLERLIEEGEGVFANEEVREESKRQLQRKRTVDVIDSVVNDSSIECKNIVKIYKIVDRKQKSDTRLKALMEGVGPIVNSLKLIKKDLELLKKSTGEIPSEFRQVGSNSLAELVTKHRQLIKETDELKERERELKNQIEFYKDAGLEWEE